MAAEFEAKLDQPQMIPLPPPPVRPPQPSCASARLRRPLVPPAHPLIVEELPLVICASYARDRSNCRRSALAEPRSAR